MRPAPLWHLLSPPQGRPEGGWRAEARVPPASPWFSGHFPGEPVVPGIALLGMVLETLRAAGDGAITGTGVKRVRFRRVIRPGEPVEITIHPIKGAWGFQITAGDEVACTGMMTVASGSSADRIPDIDQK